MSNVLKDEKPLRLAHSIGIELKEDNKLPIISWIISLYNKVKASEIYKLPVDSILALSITLPSTLFGGLNLLHNLFSILVQIFCGFCFRILRVYIS